MCLYARRSDLTNPRARRYGCRPAGRSAPSRTRSTRRLGPGRRALAQLLVDGFAGQQQPAVQRRDQRFQQQSRISVRPQLAARDTAVDDRTQRIETPGPECLAGFPEIVERQRGDLKSRAACGRLHIRDHRSHDGVQVVADGARVRCRYQLGAAVQHRVDEQVLLGRPSAVDRRLVHPRPARDPGDGRCADPVLDELVKSRGQHGRRTCSPRRWDTEALTSKNSIASSLAKDADAVQYLLQVDLR